MAIKAIRDKVIVLPIENETTTAGGIVIPDNAKEKPLKGKVIDVGTGKVYESGTVVPLEVKTDDVVLYGQFAGQTVKINGTDHLILREDDILAIID